MKGYDWFFRHVADVVSCELPSARDYLEKAIPSLKEKLLLLPNGVDDKALQKQGVEVRPNASKENLLVAVGRIGAPEKNHELLLRAAAEVDLGDWKIAFVGPVDEAFGQWCDAFLASRPVLKSKLIFTGEVTGREELYEWYNRAKVCCLTSRYESFGMVLAEALYFGNYLLTTPVAPAAFLTDSGRVGRILNTEYEWTEALRQITCGSFDTEPFYPRVRRHSETFRWSTVLPALDRSLRNCFARRTK